MTNRHFSDKKKYTHCRPASRSTHQRGALFSTLFVVILIALIVGLTLYLLKLDSIITNKFEGKRWDIPAKVYAQPLELYQGAALSPSDLTHMLKLLGYSKAANYQKTGQYHVKGGTFFIHTRGFDYGDSQDPEQVLKVSLQGNKVSLIQSTKPNKTGLTRLEPVLIGGIYPDSNEDRQLISLKQVPKPLTDALLATEDRDFYKHHGVSLRGTARALYTNMTSNRTQGGSTITQQLIKNFYLNSERTFKRKINEALMALLLELHYSKDEILQAYMNEINLGQNGNRSINGFGLAANFYFGQPLSELSTEKLALLVGIAKGPSYYNPWRNRDNALTRRNVVLKNMLTQGKLSQTDYDKLSQKPLGVVKTPVAGKNRFPDFLNVVQRQLKLQYQEDDLSSEGLRIFTTLDPLAQKKATDSFDTQIKQLRKSRGLKNLQGALVSANPQNGELLAAVGGYGTFTGFNRALDAKRQVGSLLKPVIYFEAVDSGRYNPASPVEDNPITLTSGDKTWSPQNYDKTSHGYVPLHTALAKSYNQAAVRLGMEYGIPQFNLTLKRLGVDDKLPSYPSVLLGSISLTPMDMLGIYQTFAAGGFRSPINSIRTVIDAKGKPLQRYSLEIKQSIDPASAYVTNYLLQGVVKHGTARSLQSLGNYNLAGKTGTTDDYKDSWFAGYSGNYVTVVWVGNDDNSNTRLSGSTGALPVWKSFMGKLRLEPVDLVQPRDVHWLWLDNGTGQVSDKRCQGAIYAPVLVDHTPSRVSDCAAQLYREAQIAQQQSEYTTLPTEPFEGDPMQLPEASNTPPQDNTSTPPSWLESAIGEAAEWF